MTGIGRRLVVFLCINAFLSFSNWYQDEFVIGAFYEPPLTGILSKDISIMKQIRDAHFTVLSGIGDFPSTQKEMKYRLEVLTHIPGLRTYVCDKGNYEHRVFGRGEYDSTLVQGLINSYRKLKSGLREQMYGYFIGDEPHYNRELKNMLLKINHFQKPVKEGGDPGKHAWINLFSNRAKDFWKDYPDNPESRPHPWNCSYDDGRYRSYIREAINGNIKVVCFDNYCFTSNAYYTVNPSIRIRQIFFRNYQIIASESQKAGLPFWAMANCVEHVLITRWDSKKRAVPRVEVDGPADYRTGSKPDGFSHIPEAQLKFMAHVPVIYGAKGIWWFLYSIARKPPEKKGWYYSNKAIVDENGLPTENYPVIQKINRRLEELGPTLMSLEWIGTYHGTAINNMPTTTDDPASDFMGIPERNLPVISSDTPVIKAVKGRDRRHCAVGLFVVKEKSYYYLIVMNKSIYSDASFELVFKKKVALISIDREKYSGSRKIERKIVSLALEIRPGDIRVVKIREG